MAPSPHVEVREASLEHAAELAARMRPADRNEVWASGNYDPLAAVLDSMLVGKSWAILFNGEVAAIWGVAPLRGGVLTVRTGAVWLLSTDTVDRHHRTFWRECKARLPTLMAGYDILVNAIDARYLPALRWAKRLGFHVGPAMPFGAQGQPFCPIELRREDLHV